MPYIATKVSVTLDEAARGRLTEAYHAMCQKHLGKPAQYVMTTYEDGAAMHFQGSASAPTAYVDVRVFGQLNAAATNSMTADVCKLLKEVCGIDGSRVYVSYMATPNWGYNGSNF